MPTSLTVQVVVTKGCRDLGFAKGERYTFEFNHVEGFGIRATVTPHRLNAVWLPGANHQVRMPSATPGTKIALHNGDPTRRIVVEVVSK